MSVITEAAHSFKPNTLLESSSNRRSKIICHSMTYDVTAAVCVMFVCRCDFCVLYFKPTVLFREQDVPFGQLTFKEYGSAADQSLLTFPMACAILAVACYAYSVSR